MSDSNTDPNIDYDQLLSDHLDGCLGGDDLNTLNAQLERDEGLRHQYECLLANQESLREMFRHTSAEASGLPLDFASKVAVEAFRQRAIQPNVTAASLGESTRSSRRPFIGVIATAAAVLMVASFATRTPPETELAQNEAPSSLLAIDAASPVDIGQLAEVMEDLETPRDPETLKLETSEPKSSGPQLAESTLPMRSADVSARQPEQDAINATEDEVVSAVSMDRVARRDPPAKFNDSGTPLKSSASVSIQPLSSDTLSGAVLVYDVRLSTRGRATQCVAKAMENVGMPETSRQPIDGELVSAAKSVESFDEDSKFQLLYLRAPAKQLDRLFANLLQDRENVSSLGLTLVTDSPILKVTDNLQSVDPTLIQHESGTVTLELESDNAGELAVLRRLLEDQTFLPLTSGMPATTGLNPMKSDVPSGSGRDIMSRVLLIVR